MYDDHIADPHWVKVVKETINQVRIHDLDPEVYDPDFVKEDIV